MRHITDPHLSTPEDAQAYESLLAALRKDLLLDPSVDCLPPGIVSARALPWKIDAGTSIFTWGGASRNSNVITVAHLLGRTPISIHVTVNIQSDGSFSFPVLTASSGTSFSVQASNPYEVPVLGVTAGFSWIVLG